MQVATLYLLHDARALLVGVKVHPVGRASTKQVSIFVGNISTRMAGLATVMLKGVDAGSR